MENTCLEKYNTSNYTKSSEYKIDNFDKYYEKIITSEEINRIVEPLFKREDLYGSRFGYL